ncbi:hypothetical protein GPJ56_005268 [Histomonas meleagridis]|uniref:uncharacterized protein n=1 Tax=Histomonas meleagridis TaxID=135588 RepID=UPI00355A20A8|nr:hypothetical protein GPJ56_005268 [Histomonas meleagridis]KAH0802118.1 hypothetical protein GO595_005199 [Histomonas meleagridis]
MGFQFSIQTVISILAFCIEVIAGAAYFCVFETGGTVKAGWKPKSNRNVLYYVSYSYLCFGLINLVFAIAELGLIFVPKYFSFVDSPILRGVYYALNGIATLGVAADLGIAAGSMQMIIGVVMIIVAIVTGGCKKK